MTCCSVEASCQYKFLKFRTDIDLAKVTDAFGFSLVVFFSGALLSRELRTFSFSRANWNFSVFVRPCINVQIKISQ